MKKSKNPLKIISEYEIIPDNKEKLQEIFDNMLEADKIFADMLIKYHKAKKK